MSKPFLVDSHCHLDFPDFDDDREAILDRARSEGIGIFVTISTYVARHDALKRLAAAAPDIYASVGTHPHNAGDEPDVTTAELVRLSQDERFVAIGEAGLDYFYDNAPRDIQASVFRRHIAAARDTGLPLVIHSRSADEDMIEILEDEAGKGAFPFVLHCFSSGRRLAEVGLELGGYISFSGIAAFKRSEELRAIAADIPDDRILVETDAPYLAPPPFRGKRNEPAYVRYTAEIVAEARHADLETFARQTTDNFFALFKKVPDPRG